MSYGTDFYKKINDTIVRYGNDGSILHVSETANNYDDDGDDLGLEVSTAIKYVVSELNEKERVVFSNYTDYKKLTMIYDDAIPYRKGDEVILSDGDSLTIEMTNKKGEMNGVFMVVELICLIA